MTMVAGACLLFQGFWGVYVDQRLAIAVGAVLEYYFKPGLAVRADSRAP